MHPVGRVARICCSRPGSSGRVTLHGAGGRHVPILARTKHMNQPSPPPPLHAGPFESDEPAEAFPDDEDAACLDDAAPVAPSADACRAVSLSEAELCACIRRIADERDEQALSCLYDATVSRVHALVLQIVRRPAWAEEVVEDAYYQVWRQAVRFDAARGRPLTWLLAMARSRALDALRRERRHVHEAFDPDDVDEAALATHRAGPQEASFETTRDHLALHQALAALAAPARQLVALAFLRGLSHEEIAEQTALPLGTVKSQIRRALLVLRERLGAVGLHTLAP